MEKIIIYPGRDGYSTDQCGRSITAGELIEFLSQYDEDTQVYLSTGQSYGVLFTAINSVDVEETEEDDY